MQTVVKSTPNVSKPVARVMMVSVALCWSTMGVAFKFIDWDPLVIAAVRNLLTFLYLAAYRRSMKFSLKKDVVIGALIAYLTQTAFTYANKYTSAANAIVLQYTNPVFVVLISWLFLHQKVKLRDIVLSLIMIGGTALFFLDDLSAGQLLGNVCGLISGIGMACSILYACNNPADLQEYTMLNSLISVVVGIPAAIQHPPQFDVASLIAVFFLGVVASGIATVLMAKSAPHLASVEVSMLLMLDPILNPVWVALAVGEIPGILALIGMVIVIGCVIINILVENHEETKRNKVQSLGKKQATDIPE